MDPWLLERLACPVDHGPLTERGGELACPAGHRYPVVDGIPVLLRPEVSHSHWAAEITLRQTRGEVAITDYPPTTGVDPFVQNAIGATNGNLYKPLIGKLPRYPIPDLLLPPGEGRSFLELGSHWGRWCIAASRAGYRAVGLDPSLNAIYAFRRVARQLGADCHYVVGDARHLPIGGASFDCVFSYSVLQHLPKEDVHRALAEIHRVLAAAGVSLVQMPNRFGPRALWHQLRRGFRPAREFEVRYWAPRELTREFGGRIGPSRLSVDGILCLCPQASDLDLLPWYYRPIVHLSMLARRLERRLPPIRGICDSLYVRSTRR